MSTRPRRRRADHAGRLTGCPTHGRAPATTGSSWPPTSTAATFTGTVEIDAHRRTSGTSDRSCSTPPSWTIDVGRRSSPATAAPTAGRPVVARRGEPSGSSSPSTARSARDRPRCTCTFTGDPQRQAPRLLPVAPSPTHDGAEPHHRHHPVRVDRRPPGLPLLGRARPQGRLRGHPRRRRRAGRLLQRPGGRGDARAATAARRVRFAPTMVMSTYLVAFVVGPLEATDPVDVDGVPVRVVHAPGKGAPDRVRPRGRRPTPCASSPTTSASPTRPRSSTWWPSPTSPSGPWRTWAASPSARRLLLVDPATAARDSSSSGSPT